MTAVTLVGIQGYAHAQQQPAQEQEETQDQSDTTPAQDTGTPPQQQDTPEAPVPPPPPAPPAPPAAPPPPPPPPVPVPPGTETDLSDASTQVDTGMPMEGEGEVIIITGSAIERRDLTTPAPVAIMDRTAIESTGVASIGDVLQNLPAQSNATNTQVNNGGDGSTRINLRGLGSHRNLVLVNGRRHVPGGTGANSSVDLNAIPMAAIERIEVLKDGASAVYGSDAISGVVNIITRRDFEGTEAAAYVGSSSHGDGFTYDLNLTTGANTERSNILFSAGFYEQGPIYAGDRAFSRFDYRYDWKDRNEYTVGSTGVPEGLILVPEDEGPEGMGNQAWQDLRAGACPSGDCFNDPETGWRDFRDTGTSDVGTGDFYNYQPDNYLLTPQQRYNIFSTGNYEFHPRVTGFYEASYTNRQSDQLLAPEPLLTLSEGVVVSRDNAYNPFGRDFRDVRRRLSELGNRRSIQDVDTFRIVTGLEGRLPEQLPVASGWRWNVAYNYGRTEAANVKEGNLILSRLAAAVGPSYEDAEGNLRCGTAADPGDPECVPLNLFGGRGTITKDMANYLTYTGVAKGLSQQSLVSADMSGRLFDTPWGGDVALAMGASYRDEYGTSIPDPRTVAGDTTGNKTEATAGGFQVAEAYGELSVVPVIDKPLVDWLELSGAIRAFDYSSFGPGYTWKAGGLWRIIKGFSARGTYSTAFRAPNIGELYSGIADSFPGVTDPCDTARDARTEAEQQACEAAGVPDNHEDVRTQLRSRGGGNPELEPETADIFTAGMVYEPHFLPGAALTVDYFHIALDNAIMALGTGTILSSCYGKNPDPAACALITRDPATNMITEIENPLTNLGSAKTAGVDFNLRYDTASQRAGRFLFNLEGTWLQKYNLRLPSGQFIRGKGVYDLGVFPDWRFNFSTLWNRNQWGAGAIVRFVNGFQECKNDECYVDTTFSRKVSPYATADLQGSYTLRSDAGISRFTLGMNNVLDTDPVKIYAAGGADSTDYDFLGRYAYARFTQTF